MRHYARNGPGRARAGGQLVGRPPGRSGGRGALAFAALVLLATLPACFPQPSCGLVPQLRDATVNQGVGSYPVLARGKETLVRFYLSTPRCADADDVVRITGGSLT